MTKKKIGYLGGSFDPIHFGHLNLAFEALEKMQLDEVWFCPTTLSPHKKGTKPVEITHRLKMVELALDGLPPFKMIENEAHAGSSPYTFETLLELKKDPENQDKIFYLLLSEDLLEGLHKWHKIHDLLREFPVFIASRKHSKPHILNSLDKKTATEIKNKITPTRTLEISSSNLKDRLKNNLYCPHLIPGKVLDYIYLNELY